MNKKEISGQMYVIIGSAMLLMSVLIDYEKLMLFILAGAVFIVVGFFKLVMKSGESKKNLRKQPSHHVQHARTIRCRNCQVKVHPLFKFCPNCGHKLFMEEHQHKAQHRENPQ